MKVKCLILAAFCAACLLSACGGGGGSTSASGGSTNPPAPTPVASYACDRNEAAANLPRTASVSGVSLPALSVPTPAPVFERWALTVNGKSETVSVAFAFPPAGVATQGIVIYNHGISPSYVGAPPSQMMELYLDAQMSSRGYITAYVSALGYFGSTGDFSPALSELGQKYQSHAISYADYEAGAWKLRAAPVVAGMEKMATDVRFSPYMSRILMMGLSGGAEVSLQAAFDSNVFHAASKKAVIRLTGKDSALDTNPEAGPGANEYAVRIANTTYGSLWFGGESDQTTSLGGLACEFKFFNQPPSSRNLIYAVPAMGHGSLTQIFSAPLFTVAQKFLQENGFPGF